MTINETLTPKRKRVRGDALDRRKRVERDLAALVRSSQDGATPIENDPMDVLLELRNLDRIVHQTYLEYGASVQRDHYSWRQIARALGEKSGQVVQQRFGR